MDQNRNVLDYAAPIKAAPLERVRRMIRVLAVAHGFTCYVLYGGAICETFFTDSSRLNLLTLVLWILSPVSFPLIVFGMLLSPFNPRSDWLWVPGYLLALAATCAVAARFYTSEKD